MSAWDLLTDSSTAPEGSTAWDHLNAPQASGNEGSGGGVIVQAAQGVSASLAAVKHDADLSTLQSVTSLRTIAISTPVEVVSAFA